MNKYTYHDSLRKITLRTLMGKASLFTAGKKKGSFTAETAVVLPLFLFFMLTVFVFFDVLAEQDQLQMDFAKTAKNAALLACGTKETDLVCFQTMHQVSSDVAFFGRKHVYGYVKISARPWTGADARFHTGGLSAAGEMVYKTESGSVYHTNPDCSYLHPSVEAIQKAKLSSKRNDSGEIYKPCESCGLYTGSLVYITDHGNRYHGSISCSGLKRNIHVISKTEAEGYPHCSKCAAWEAMK